MEIQSLKQVSFLYSVCHVVIVVQDWFTDLSLLRFLLTAEMLTKPTSSEINAKEVSSLKEQSNQLPNIVFVYNRACEKDYHPDCLNSMLSVTEELFRHSRLRYRGSVSQFQFEVVNATGISKSLTDINIFLLPIYDCNEKESDKFDTASAENPNSSPTNLYMGHPNYDVLYQSLENQILAIPRDSFSNSLTERGWYA
ncbi:uncharacterized protein TRIADDRAFT_51276 [Trichoplax adhaerens]|uniref:Uncharacterized protein n=1 Tax=Trichoplax adhaerens TaxID=10228 RepID=B3RI59_TRIAD|nr:hypothetical protein TRIADDRAFT_51276 [Trichoplax adhaerens]EDV29214.1 hypothetical protein TRIADDRAFT_51276 [Trichoplax adhaerens]|eukprot:XP_002108416.1 hypothetical protein TRIADDRAFT_51276 [Trichoplax adhaerens]